ncbi:hypothetical protein GYMLUDRAFT_174155, partial [Collybiopsis luxurians FD-317 M1]
RNIVLFGATGSGKSPIVNMLFPSNRAPAPASSAANLVTFGWKPYTIDAKGERFTIYDTAGLSEGSNRSLFSKAARKSLESLLLNLSHAGQRVHLLLLCIRAPRITEVVARNYKLFYQAICKRQVPIAVIVTGLEHQTPTMESWWRENQHVFKRYHMVFTNDAHACITAIRGRPVHKGSNIGTYHKEYTESVEVVKNLIRSNALSTEKGWTFNPVSVNVSCMSGLPS